MTYVSHYKRLPIAGLVLAIAMLLIVTLALGSLPLVAFVSLLAATSLGLGTILPVTTVAIQNSVSPHLMGTATGVMNFFRSLGGALMVACFGAIVLGNLSDAGAAATSIEGFLTRLSGSGRSITEIFQWIFAAATLGLALSLLSFLLMEERPLRGKVT
jgi:hypothetical protein